MITRKVITKDTLPLEVARPSPPVVLGSNHVGGSTVPQCTGLSNFNKVGQRTI